MTFAAVVAVLYPFLNVKAPKADASDIEVYKDQLKEIEADEKRGLITAPEAANARIEVSRRILRADARHSVSDFDTGGHFSKALLVCAALSVPIVSWGLYVGIGSPNMGDQPITARLSTPAAEASVDVLVAKAEAHLAANPNDGRGWAVLAPIYYRMARFEDSIKAYERAGKLNGQSAVYDIGIGQAWSALNGGLANDAARAAFKRASERDPNNPEPKLLLATDLAQQGKFKEAMTAFETILTDAPANAAWRPMLVDMIARVDKAMAAAPDKQSPGPTQNDVEQAAGLSNTDRTAMIEGMVAQLDAKLAENPSDGDGWGRLMRSYTVLNNPEKALETLGRARIGLKDSPKGLIEINALAVALGIVKS